MRIDFWQHHFMWHSAGFTNARISETGTWEAVPELTLTFLLPELASIRVLYSISVMPEYIYLNEGEALFHDSLAASAIYSHNLIYEKYSGKSRVLVSNQGNTLVFPTIVRHLHSSSFFLYSVGMGVQSIARNRRISNHFRIHTPKYFCSASIGRVSNSTVGRRWSGVSRVYRNIHFPTPSNKRWKVGARFGCQPAGG